jgi:hypothetical protein
MMETGNESEKRLVGARFSLSAVSDEIANKEKE